MREPFIPYASPSIQEEDRQAVLEVLKGKTISRGIKVTEFEQAIANFCRANYAVAFNSGTSALMAACFAAKLSSYDHLVSTPNTFISTIGAALNFGVKPDFVDIDRDTGHLDLGKLKEKLHFRSSRGRLIVIPVHFSGIPLDMYRLNRAIATPNCVIIEDAAHALGSSYLDGTKVGSCMWSDMTLFSFQEAGIMTTGEGGMVTTNDPQLDHRLRLYRDNGIEREADYLEGQKAPDYYEVHSITGNFNFTDFQAALGLSQFKRLQASTERRRYLVQLYKKQLRDIPHIRLFIDTYDHYTAFCLFVVQIDFQFYSTTRAQVMERLKAEGIETRVHYIPIYQHPFFKRYKSALFPSFPEMDLYYQQTLSLPLYYELTKEDVYRICRTLKNILKCQKQVVDA